MNAPAPYLVLRDFRVWFPKRKGFLEAMRRSEPDFIRAVDGVDMDILKGEIYCLVGESGCGKTTTGKGILRLVEPSGGDVFVGAPAEALASYEEAKGSNREDALEDIRERWSLSYRERVQWSVRDIGILTITCLVGLVLASGIFAGLVAASLVLRVPGADLLAPILAGIVLGAAATLPPARSVSVLPKVAATFAIPSLVLGGLFGAGIAQVAAGSASDLGATAAAYGRILQSNVPLLVLQVLVILGTAWIGASRGVAYWQARRGIESDKIRKLRKVLQIIFQDPYESLNPKHSVFDIVSEPLIVNAITRHPSETKARVRQALNDAGLRPPEDFMYRYPHELSGGQRQRVSIAGALVLDPDFLVADEPVSMLDVSIRTEIIELLLELRKKKGLTYLFITHDLSLAWILADRIGVMYLGKIVEEGPTSQVVKNPRHPYTKALISVVPVPDPDRRHERTILRGERPDPANIPAGCRFHPRCPVAFEKCGWTSDEVLDELRQVAVGEAGVQSSLARAFVDGPLSITLPDGAATEGWIRATVAGRSEQARALKGIRSIEASGAGLRLLLHPLVEPTLTSVADHVKVSCHLFGSSDDARSAS